MKSPFAIVTRRCLPVLATALLLTAAGPLGASTSLFPDLQVQDFPETPNAVRIDVVAARPGGLSARAFHGRPRNIGFPSLLDAVVSIDPETRRDRLDVVRIDDHCVAAAERARLSPAEGCMSMTVTEVVDGIAVFVLKSRYFGYQLQFTLAQSLHDESLWTLIPTGRRGEPQRLEVRTREDGHGQLAVAWELYNRDGGGEIELPLAASIDSGALRAAGFSALQGAALVSLDLFYDVADFYLDPWVVYQDGEIVDEGIPSPEENDPSVCEPVGVCGAEHRTCVPTHNGWYGCNFPTEVGGWGGGFFDPPGGGNGGPGSTLPNWAVVKYPLASSPLFNGLMPFDDPAQGQYIEFRLNSVLEEAATVAKKGTVSATTVEGGHMFDIFLAHDGEVVPSQPTCGEFHWARMTIGTTIAAGERMRFPQADSERIACMSPERSGIYVLRWRLDPLHLWDEGPDGEADNEDYARGAWYYRGY